LSGTGVFETGTKPRFTPKATVNNVLDAVKHGMEREYRKALKASLERPELAAAIAEE